MAWAESKDFRVPLVPSRPTACQGDYIVPTLEYKNVFILRRVVRFFSPLAWGLPCPQWWVTWARSERARSYSSSISLLNLSQSFNLPLSTSHQVLLVLYLSPLLLAWGLQLLILLLLPALQSSIYKGLSSLASTSLSFYQVQGPETHPIGLNQTELVSIHQYWPQSTTNGLNQSDLVLIHQTWSQSIRIGLIHEN